MGLTGPDRIRARPARSEGDGSDGVGRPRAILWALLPLALVLLSFSGALGAEQGLFYRDHSLFFRPEWWSIYTQLREGTLPVLSLTHPSGQPHEFSTNYALFTPTTLLLLSGPFHVTYDVFVVSHFVVLALGAHLLLRELGCEAPTAAAGSVVAALVGPILSFDSLLVGLSGIAYAPWVWWALVRLVRAPNARNTALLALSTAFGVQGLMPELVLLHGLAAAFITWHTKPRPSVRMGIALLAAAALGVLVAGVDLFPQLDALAGSRRWAGFGKEELEGWSLGAHQLIEFLAPAFWASPNLYFFNVPIATGSSVDPPYLPTLYLGLALPFALTAPFLTDGRARFAAAGAVFFLLVAAGAATPLHGWLTSLPLLRSGRFAIKYLVLVVPMFVGLAVSSLQTLERGRRWRRLCLALGVQAAILVGVLSWLASPSAREWLSSVAQPFRGTTPFEAYQGDVVGMALSEMSASAGHAASFSGLAFLVASLGLFRAPWRPKLLLVLGLLMAADLGSAVSFGVPLGPVEATRLPSEVTSRLGSTRPVVKPGPPRIVPHIEGQTPFADHLVNHGRHGLLAWENFRVFDAHDLEGLAMNPVRPRFVDWLDGLPGDASLVLLARAGVRYHLGQPPTLGRELLRFPDHVGRALVLSEVPEAQVERSSLHTEWIGLSITSTHALGVLTDRSRLGTPVIWSEPSGVISSPGCRAEISEVRGDLREAFHFRTSAACPAMLVLREVWYPRWTATVDGQPVELRLADAGVVAVPVPEGRHEVSIIYSSLTRRYLAVSASAAVLCAILLGLTLGRNEGRAFLARLTKRRAHTRSTDRPAAPPDSH